MEHARPATADDLPVLAALLVAEHAELAPLRGGDLWLARQPAATESRLASALGDPEALVLAGTYDDVVVGIATAALVDAPGLGVVATVGDLFVEPAAREVGVGAVLIDAVKAWAVERCCVGVDASVLPGSRAAKNFFEAHGMVARSITVHHRFAPDLDGAR